MLKRLYVICLCLLCALAVRSQNISVASFKMDENDITANMEGTMVYDQNGEKCALIRIQTTHTGFTFDVGALGVRDVVQKTGEIWLYIPYGVRHVTMRHQQLGTMEYAFPMSIEKARTYVMQLTTGEVQTIVKNAVTSQYVLFRLTPSDALVELDGQVLETVDGTATKRMPFGKYNYRVQAPRHAPSVGVVTVNDSKNKHIVTVNLVPQFTNVTLRVADNAEIWIDDQRQGVGTCTVELGYGTYLVECRKGGHRASQQEVVVNKESALNAINLKAPTPIFGAVDINTIPADAEVWIDGKQAGTTPMFLSECLVGKHQVTFKKSGYKERTLSFDVAEGQTATVMENLEKGAAAMGTLSDGEDRKTFTVNGVSFRMVAVKGGTFRMGSDDGSAYSDESPVHSVTLSDYYIGETEVTQELWQAVMGSNPSRFKGNLQRPVEKVCWNDCQAFVRKLNDLTGGNFRLPTEAEWEYAARGGNKSQGYKYSGSDNIDEVAWYTSNSGGTTHAIKTKSPNELGIYDMSGNVYEWCEDRYGSYSSASLTNPKGVSSGSNRMSRGGSWYNNATRCRCAYRNSYTPSYTYNNLGLRLAM